MFDDKLYLVDAQNGTATSVFDFSTIPKARLASVDAQDGDLEQ